MAALGCPKWIKGSAPALLSIYTFLGICLSVTIAVVGAFDYANSKTTPLARWSAMIWVELGLMSFGLLLALVTLRTIPGQSAYSAGNQTLVKSSSMPGDPRAYCIERVSAQAMYFAVQTVFLAWIIALILFVYHYTTDETGVQAGLDGGLPNDDGVWTFTVQRKNDFLLMVQLQGVISLACVVNYLIKCQAQATSKCK